MLGNKPLNIDFQMKINTAVAQSKQIRAQDACGSSSRGPSPQTFTSTELCPRCSWVFCNIKFPDSLICLTIYL